jgi:oligosaccharyltransferase complex subunit gamma
MNAWISRQLPDGPRPAIVRPINYTRVAVFATTILGIITFLSAAHPIIIPLVQNRNVWAAISLIAILLFTSGQMFNHIRKVPYIGGDGKNGISYFAGGFSNQFGLETQIIAAICMKLFPIMLQCLPLSRGRAPLTLRRWRSFVCDNCACSQSSTVG